MIDPSALLLNNLILFGLSWIINGLQLQLTYFYSGNIQIMDRRVTHKIQEFNVKASTNNL